jgi:L-ribulose-5-phosphate 4-epimerase
MFEQEKRDIIRGGIKLDRYGLIALGGGNLSMRTEGGEILMTPSGMIYEDMMEADILVLRGDGAVIEGERKPSSDKEALLYIYDKRPDINAVIHTHQPYATAIGLVADEFVCNLTTLANAVRGSVAVAPYASAASLDMGVHAVEHLNDRLAVILKHHGVIGVGGSLKQALYACVYLEEAAKTYIAAKSMGGDMALLTQADIDRAVEIFKTYGQKSA